MSKKHKPKVKVIVITGPTASGKTSLSMDISQKIDTEIISADSRQIYKYMDICTAKPDKGELQQVKHHFIDSLEPDEEFSAGEFAERALTVLDEIINKGKTPIVCGGSGFYIKALFEGLFDEEKNISDEIREKLNKRYKSEGVDQLYNELLEVDRPSAEKYKDKNPRRIIRALEYYYSTGKPISESHKEKNIEQDKYEPVYFAIDHPREILYDRINERSEKIWNGGLLEETRSLLEKYPKNLNSLNTVGYKEAIEFLEGNISEEEALEEFKKNTRRYAKRQLTWFRKIENLIWIDYKLEDKANFVMNKFESLKESN